MPVGFCTGACDSRSVVSITAESAARVDAWASARDLCIARYASDRSQGTRPRRRDALAVNTGRLRINVLVILTTKNMDFLGAAISMDDIDITRRAALLPAVTDQRKGAVMRQDILFRNAEISAA